jgi:hypothetical protein
VAILAHLGLPTEAPTIARSQRPAFECAYTATLKRDIQAIVEREGESGRIGKGMLDEVERMFTWWHRR